MVSFLLPVAKPVRGGAECPPWLRKICQKPGKEGTFREKEEKSVRKGNNWEGSFTFSGGKMARIIFITEHEKSTA